MNRSMIRYVTLTVVSVEAVFLFLTGLLDLYYRDGVFMTYFLCALFFGAIGIVNALNKPKNDVFYAREAMMTTALSWIVLSLVGACPLYFSKEAPSFIDAFFEIVSGFTTTGSTIFGDVEILSHATLFWRSFTHLLGGMGVLVFVLAILPMAGGYAFNIMKAESPGPVVGKLVSKISRTAKILYLIYFSITALEIFDLILLGMPVFDAVTHSFATAGTGGFGILSDSIASYSHAIQNTIGIFMIIFGINFNVFYLLMIRHVKEAFAVEEMRIYLGIIAFAVLAITINIYPLVGTIADALRLSFFQVASIITTTGFATADFDLWPTFSKTILVLLMFIGACAGSTGGGLKVSRIVILFKSIRIQLNSYIHPRKVDTLYFEGKPVDTTVVSSICAYFVIYFFIFFVSVLIVSLDGFDFTSCFTAVAATLNNIGPGLSAVGPTQNFFGFSVLSKLVLAFDMLAGRLEVIPMLVLFMPSMYKR